MDFFGIGAALKGSFRISMQAARRTGRTVSLVESVEDGDRICFLDGKEAHRVNLLCKERGVKVDCIVVDPKTPERIFERAPSFGRTIFDHGWVEAFYLHRIDECTDDLAYFEKSASRNKKSNGIAMRTSEELARWAQ